jgi:hypothetical protein
MQPLIGIVGGSGAIGRLVAQRLSAGAYEVRIGNRHPGRHTEPDALLGRSAEYLYADANDEPSLHHFCTDCLAVVNCVGPSWNVSERIAQAALDAGAHYIDLSGDATLMLRLVGLDLESRRRTAVLSAGLMPGLSGLLPRYLATEFDAPQRLTAYVAILDRFSHGAAADYLAGLDQSEPCAAWRAGARARQALRRLNDVDLPFFTARVAAYPYLNDEAERTARHLALDESDWYAVFEGRHVPAMLTRFATAKPCDEFALGRGVAELMDAAALDVAGRAPYQRLLFELAGAAAGRQSKKSLVLWGTSTPRITAAVAALATEAAVHGDIAFGAHFADDVLDPTAVVLALRSPPYCVQIDIAEGSLASAAAATEGVL